MTVTGPEVGHVSTAARSVIRRAVNQAADRDAEIFRQADRYDLPVETIYRIVGPAATT
jgi:hypothetical protein